MSLGKITNSIFSATNENTAALANINFDFSLVKFEAPKEFAALGKALSSKRRSDAEDGHQHRTARRLGALFDALLPSIPRLTQAYGLRVSSIIQSPDVNPQTSKNYGPFQDYVGADGTSIWAAVTSSSAESPTHSPLAVHLLACMLARAFKPSEATAIWSEIVAERQKKIQTDFGDLSFTQSSLWAARQEITRRELAEWDASARAWLRSADDVKNSEQTRLMLILKNVSCPVSSAKSTYSQVVEAWIKALSGFECLLKGMPQQVSNASILLALSSWHLYPSLNVLSKPKPVSVTFDDPLLRKEAAITIGLFPSDPEKAEGMTWSLMLSHLRYYGDPVAARASDDNTRVPMHKLRCIALAGLLAYWNIPLKDTLSAAQFLTDLFFYYGSGRSLYARALRQTHSFEFLRLAGKDVLELQKEDEAEFESLIRYGRRRAKQFLVGEDQPSLPPMFGLFNTHILYALVVDDPREIPISYLRSVAKSMNLKSSDAIISYPHPNGIPGLLVYATAVPHERASLKRSSNDETRTELVHCRWVVQHYIGDSYSYCSCDPVCMSTCFCARNHNICSPFCHTTEKRRCQSFGFKSPISDQNMYSKYPGEVFYELDRNQLRFDNADTLFWAMPPRLFHSHGQTRISPSCASLLGISTCKCFDQCLEVSHMMHDTVFSLVKGRALQFALWVNINPEVATNVQNFCARFEEAAYIPVSLTTASDLIGGQVNRASLVYYMTELQLNTYDSGRHGASFDNGLSISMHDIVMDRFGYAMQFWESTRALALASFIYQSLHGATIALRILSTKLTESFWLPPKPEIGKYFDFFSLEGEEGGEYESNTGEKVSGIFHMSLEARFACIAMFESGVQNIEPTSLQDVMALSSNNSLFIARRLISDPSSKISSAQVQRIVGNIGRSGITMLVPPRDPRTRPPSDDYRLVTHAPYDGKREDNFQSTSLHLSFTEWEVPLDVDTRSAIDVEVSLLEAVISLYDSGQWIGDLDILKIPHGLIQATKHVGSCDVAVRMEKSYPKVYSNGTSIDTWEEFLDPPEGTAIFRSHKNWPARLAALCLALRNKMYDEVILVDPDVAVCNFCLRVDGRSSLLID